MPAANYMSGQNVLKWRMRVILVDWLVEVHAKFHMLPETLFLTVNLIDRMLSVRQVSVEKLQLVGIAAMFVAAKYEEVSPPSVNDFVFMADGGYQGEEILSAERHLLGLLKFDLSCITIAFFKSRKKRSTQFPM